MRVCRRRPRIPPRVPARGSAPSRDREDPRTIRPAAARAVPPGILAGRLVAAIVLALLVPGCLARLTVRKVAPDDTTTPGVRYSLPRPFLRVTPGADGTIQVDVVILPDRERTYAIDASSVLASHEIEVAVERGLLRRVAWSADSSGAAAEAVRAAGSATEAVLARQAEERSRAEDDACERQEARAAARARADAEVDRARQDLDEARAALATLISWGGWSDEVRQARVRVAVAQAALDAAEERRRRLLGGAVVAARSAARNPARGTDRSTPPSARGGAITAATAAAADRRAGNASRAGAARPRAAGAVTRALAPAGAGSGKVAGATSRAAGPTPVRETPGVSAGRDGTASSGARAPVLEAGVGRAALWRSADVVRARGPILYALDERLDHGRPSLSLVAIEGPDGDPQPTYDTAMVFPPPAPEDPPSLRPAGGLYPILPSRSRILAAEDALDEDEARLEELRAGGATPLSIANAMADVAEAKIALARAHRLELTIEVSRPISRLLFDGGRTWLVRTDDERDAAARERATAPGAASRIPAEASRLAPAPASPPSPASLTGGAGFSPSSVPRASRPGGFAPPTSDDLRRWLLLASPAEIRLTLPDDIPDGDYTLRIGFEHGAAGPLGPATSPDEVLDAAEGTLDFTIERGAER